MVEQNKIAKIRVGSDLDRFENFHKFSYQIKGNVNEEIEISFPWAQNHDSKKIWRLHHNAETPNARDDKKVP
jgi:hypothetical protein